MKKFKDLGDNSIGENFTHVSDFSSPSSDPERALQTQHSSVPSQLSAGRGPRCERSSLIVHRLELWLQWHPDFDGWRKFLGDRCHVVSFSTSKQDGCDPYSSRQALCENWGGLFWSGRSMVVAKVGRVLGILRMKTDGGPLCIWVRTRQVRKVCLSHSDNCNVSFHSHTLSLWLKGKPGINKKSCARATH